MCLAIPGKIIEITNDQATIDYGNEKRVAKILMDDYSIGDFVIVQNQIIIEKIPNEEAKAWFTLLKESKRDL